MFTDKLSSNRYNELLRIEEELGESAIYAGDHFRTAHDL